MTGPGIHGGRRPALSHETTNAPLCAITREDVGPHRHYRSRICGQAPVIHRTRHLN